MVYGFIGLREQHIIDQSPAVKNIVFKCVTCATHTDASAVLVFGPRTVWNILFLAIRLVIVSFYYLRVA